MPERKTLERARRDKRQGKAPSTQAGEFIREEIEHVREGKHGARSPEQAIVIGLSKARRAGVKLKPPKKGSAAVKKALKRMPHKAASKKALSRHAKKAAKKRTKADRSAAARKAARTRKAEGK